MCYDNKSKTKKSSEKDYILSTIRNTFKNELFNDFKSNRNKDEGKIKIKAIAKVERSKNLIYMVQVEEIILVKREDEFIINANMNSTIKKLKQMIVCELGDDRFIFLVPDKDKVDKNDVEISQANEIINDENKIIIKVDSNWLVERKMEKEAPTTLELDYLFGKKEFIETDN